MAEVATEKEVSEAPAEQKETREEEEGAREVGRDGKSPEKETAGVLGEGRDEESGSDESEEEEEKEVEGESSRISSREDKMARLRELHRRRVSRTLYSVQLYAVVLLVSVGGEAVESSRGCGGGQEEQAAS